MSVGRDVAKLFLFYNFFQSFIVWTPGVKNGIFTIFGPVLAILVDFLTEKGKKCMKQKSCVMLIPNWQNVFIS